MAITLNYAFNATAEISLADRYNKTFVVWVAANRIQIIELARAWWQLS